MSLPPAISSPYGELSMYQITTYYAKIRDQLLEQFKDKNVALLRMGSGKPFFQRHGSTEKWLKIRSTADFDYYNNQGVLEWIPEVGVQDNEFLTPRYIVDLDPKGSFEWPRTCAMACEIISMFMGFGDVERVTCNFSGNRGFHISGWMKEPALIEACREKLKVALNRFVNEEIRWSMPRAQTEGLLMDLSPLKRHGVIKCLGSLSAKTGLAVVEVKEPSKFEKEMARVIF